MSHPMWVRGLKLLYQRIVDGELLSHPMWVRGLKPGLIGNRIAGNGSRTPCGCVD